MSLKDGLYHQLEKVQVLNNVARWIKSSLRRRRITALRTLNAWEQTFYSQNGEDGILREIFMRIGPTNRFFVEFGVGDGSECNSAIFSRELGWGGVMIEADGDQFTRLEAAFRGNGSVKTVNAFISRDNIVDLFENVGVPREFDLLSIDIDGNDYWVWQRLGSTYEPRVVVIEYNASLVPPKRWVMQYNPNHRWDLSTYFGASLESLAALGSRLGYALVGTESHGVNAVFVRRDLLPHLGLPEKSAADAYHAPRYGAFAIKHRPGSGPYEDL